MPSASKDVERKRAVVDLGQVVQVASALLAGTHLSSREPQEVARVAIAQVKALATAVDTENA